MKISSKQLAEMMARNPRLTIDNTTNKGPAYPRQEERKDVGQRKADNRPKEAGGNRGNRPIFGLTATFLVADNRRRDIDNMLSTMQDSLIDASGRLLAEHSACSCHGGSSGERK